MAKKIKRFRVDANFPEAEKTALANSFKNITSKDPAVRATASDEIVQALELPLRKVLLSGDIIGGIFSNDDFINNPLTQYPLDLLTPGQEREFYAYVIPSHGDLPQRRVEADYLMVPTYRIGNAIDCTLKFLRDANWPVINRMMEVLEAGFVKKLNNDGWQTILAAATDRNILVNDPAAVAGQFTPRLVTLAKQFMRRNGGGNSTTLNRSKLTDLYISPEGKDDIRAWGLDLIPDAVRERIYYSDDNGTEVMRVFDVNIHDLDELGVDQEYQNYYTTTLAGSLAASDTELGIALDRQREDSFVSPMREDVQIFEDNMLHRRGLFGMYGFTERGFGVLDSRRCLLCSF